MGGVVLRTLNSIFNLMIADWQREAFGFGAGAELGSPGIGDLDASSELG